MQLYVSGLVKKARAGFKNNYLALLVLAALAPAYACGSTTRVYAEADCSRLYTQLGRNQDAFRSYMQGRIDSILESRVGGQQIDRDELASVKFRSGGVNGRVSVDVPLEGKLSAEEAEKVRKELSGSLCPSETLQML